MHKNYLIVITLFLISPWNTVLSGEGPGNPKPVIRVKDNMTPLSGNSVHLTGFLGEKIDLCIKNRIKAQDVPVLIDPFRNRTETRFWQSEFWGKWITSAIAAYRYNNDKALLAIIKKAVSDLLATQSPDGYIGNYEAGSHLKEWDVWGRKYTLLGLISYFDISGDQNVLKAAIDLTDHLLTEVGPGKSNIVLTGNYRGMPSCSILEPIVLLYRRTGEARFLDFAEYIVRQWETPEGPGLISKALSGTDVALRFPKPEIWWTWENGGKAYEMMSCYEGLLELYRITGEPQFLQSVEMAVENIMEKEINIAGSGSSDECWYHGHENQIYPAYHTMETCVTTTWMKLCYNLLQLTGKSVYADQLEKSTYNALLASMKPDGSTFAKYSPLEGFRSLGEGQCGMPINCCVANAPRAFLLLPAFAILKTDRGMAINLYCQSEMNIRYEENNMVKIRQITDYPVSDSIVIEVTPEREGAFDVNLRIPAWSEVNTLSINGKPSGEVKAGTYKPISRTWKKGDRIVLKLELKARLEKLDNRYALVRGPVVLARDSRFRDGFVDETSSVIMKEGGIPLKYELRNPLGNEGEMWMRFSTDLEFGTNQEIRERIRNVRFCDYASAGNRWDSRDRFQVWLTGTVDTKEK